MNPSLYFYPIAPTSEPNSAYTPELLAGTGTTEAHSATKLSLHKKATLQVGAAAIRIVWYSTSGTSDRVATTSVRLPAGALVHWTVTGNDQYISIEEADGTSGYEAWLWQSSP